jgi:hypothetical protein
MQDLHTILKELAKQQWDNSKSPLLLSSIPTLLLKQEFDYKSQLQDKGLKSYIEQTNGNGYKLVTHPVHKAKVGIIPEEEDFKFQTEDLGTAPKNISSSSRERVVIDFLNALSTLPASDIEKVNIPASILAKLLK